MLRDLWEPRDLADGQCLTFRLGRLTLWAQRAAGEWRLAWQYGAPAGSAEVTVREPRADAGDWRRFAAPAGRLRLRPSLPDRPLVVRPEADLILLPGNTIAMSVDVPVGLRVEVLPDDGRPAAVLADVPGGPLTAAWVGTLSEGEVCHALRNRARHAAAGPLPPSSGCAGCAIRVRNDTAAPLAVGRICLPTPAMSLFAEGDNLWTSDLSGALAGADQPVRPTAADGPPAAAPGSVRLTAAGHAGRIEALTARVFGGLRNLGGAL
jgi:hypothetical protein